MAAYTSLTLAQFLYTVCKAYPDLNTVLALITDGQSPEYLAFHAKTTSEHVTAIQFQQRGHTYLLNRISNLRDTTGAERYTYTLWDEDSLKAEDINIAYRIYKDSYYPWVTVPIANV